MDAMETTEATNETDNGALLALVESQAARFSRIIKVLLVCWAASLILMGSLFVCLINSSEEEITTEVAQEADNNGSNVFSSGDYSYYGSKANS